MQPKSMSYWAEFGISPEKAQRRADIAKLLEQAKKNVSGLSKPELLAICDKLKIASSEQDSHSLASAIIAAVPQSDLIGLHLFLKSRNQAATWAARTNRSLATAVKGIAKPKPFTVLLLALKCKPKLFKDIFYYAAWCGTSTSARFIARDQKSQSSLAGVLSKSTVTKLSKFLNKASGLGASIVGTHKLPDGTFVVLFNKHYVPTVKKDYVAEFTVQHGCGRLVLGYSADDKTIHIKGGGAQLIAGVEAFFERDLDYPLLRTDVQEVNNSKFDKFSRIVIEGDASLTGELRLVGVAFKRNAHTGQPFEISPGEDQMCIASSVQKFHETQHTAGLTLLDVKHFTLVHGAHTHLVTTKHLPNGAVVLTYDNRGTDGTSQQRFQDEVFKQLGLLLHRQLSPINLPEGKLRVIACLLQQRRKDRIEEFQKAIADLMETSGIVHVSNRTILRCSNKLCKAAQTHVSDSDQETEACQQCGNEFEQVDVQQIEPDHQAIISKLDPLLAATCWKRHTSVRKFEGTEYHELVATDDRTERSIVLLDAHRLTEATREKLDRLGKPIVLLNTGLVKSTHKIDAHGVAHLSIPRLVNDILEGTDEATNALPVLLDQISRAHRERIHKAARRSMDSLTNGGCRTGKEFEQDIYNLLRIVFPHSVRLGREGKIEPDGMIQVRSHMLQQNGEIIPTACIGYDSKFNGNGKGYDLPIDERRKVRDYVKQYQSSRTKFGKFREICSHAFISNRMDEKQVENTVKYLRSSHGLKLYCSS